MKDIPGPYGSWDVYGLIPPFSVFISYKHLVLKVISFQCNRLTTLEHCCKGGHPH